MWHQQNLKVHIHTIEGCKDYEKIKAFAFLIKKFQIL